MKPFLVFLESNTTVGTLYFDKAVEMGYTPILLTSDRTRYSFADSVRTKEVSTSSADAIDVACDELEREAPILGLLSTSDYFLEVATRAARRRNLSGPDPASITICRNKYEQRRALAAAGLPSPVFRLCHSVADALSPKISLPAILKPIDGSGSRGVRLCRTIEEIRDHAVHLLSAKTNERGLPAQAGFIAESYLDGLEYSAEVIGDRVVAVTGKHLGMPPNFIETGHDVPPLEANLAAYAIQETMARIIKALSLGNAPAHVEFRLVGGQVAPIEINPRIAGGNIPKLVRLATGVDLVEQCLRFYTGQPIITKGKVGSPAAIRFLVAQRPGTITEIDGLERALGEAGVVEAAFIRKPGDVLQIYNDFRDRIAYVIASGKTTSSAAENAAHALQRLQYSLE